MHVIGTAGHVDHGKSALVKALSGMDPDRFEEEKRRGLTIDLGFAWCKLPSGREIGLVDVPGHERFIKNMLAGVGAIDAALFVVAADAGWMPQSAEHLQILDFLDVRSGIVVLTKSDLADADMISVVRSEVTGHVKGTVLDGAPIVAVSSVTGAGMDELRRRLDDLLSTVAPDSDRGRPRLFIDRSFTITGAGTVVTGTLTGGSLRAGAEVDVLPSGHRVRVRSLQTHQRPVEEAEPGSRVAANLVGLDRREIARGDALVTPDSWKLSDSFAARLRTSRDLAHPLVEKGAYELYIGSAEIPCRLKFLEDPLAEAGRSPAMPPGSTLLVQVFMMRPAPLEPGDRFIIRDVGRWETVAGGCVLDHTTGRIRRGDPEVLDRLRAREASEHDELVARVISERRLVARSDLQWLAGAGPRDLDMALGRATSARQIVSTPGFVLDSGMEQELRASALDALAVHHADNPLDPGMPREPLRLHLTLGPRAFTELVDAWASAGHLVAEGTWLRLPGHEGSMAPEQRDEADRVLKALRDGGFSPPETPALGASHELLKALERSGEIVAIAPGLAYAADVMQEAERKVIDLIKEQGPATVGQVRDVIGTTRKYAVPLLEYFDSSGLTRRQDDARVLGPRGRKLAGVD
ncbi:MAG TPA: selenocysteine-specific translation elongation factor [Actinomycetota bacterium]|nr:selenocysteine-specific translation elongation factor [Actinomycetota bacterium]